MASLQETGGEVRFARSCLAVVAKVKRTHGGFTGATKSEP
jgi:hypothetical protein